MIVMVFATMACGVRADVEAPKDSSAAHAPDTVKLPMNMNAPMDGAMEKPGMTKGDVQAAERRHRAQMKKELEREQQTMPPAVNGTVHPPRR